MIEGDSILELNYTAAAFEARVGTLEEMREKLRQRGVQVGGRTRKEKRRKRRGTRKHK